MIAGWSCQGYSHAGVGRGQEDSKSSLFWDLIRLMQWWFFHQPRYIFKNIPLLGDSLNKVLECGHYVRQDLEIPILWMPRALVPMPTSLDGFGPTSHRHLFWLQHFLHCLHLLLIRWMTSWIQTGLLCRLFEMIYPRWHWSTQWGHHGGPFPTFMTFPQSFNFRGQGLGMVWDAHTKIHTEPLVDKRKRAMEFHIGTTVVPGLSKGQRCFVLGQAMDLHTMVTCIVSVLYCLVLQQHHGDQLLSLGAEDYGQGA